LLGAVAARDRRGLPARAWPRPPTSPAGGRCVGSETCGRSSSRTHAAPRCPPKPEAPRSTGPADPLAVCRRSRPRAAAGTDGQGRGTATVACRQGCSTHSTRCGPGSHAPLREASIRGRPGRVPLPSQRQPTTGAQGYPGSSVGQPRGDPRRRFVPGAPAESVTGVVRCHQTTSHGDVDPGRSAADAAAAGVATRARGRGRPHVVVS
jgi:hypothetical protein